MLSNVHTKTIRFAVQNIYIKDSYILVVGPVGLNVQQFGGSDLVYHNSSLFFKSATNYGTFCALLLQKIKGVSYGYYLHLNFKGLGFRFRHFRNKLLIRLGFTHFLEYTIPSTVSVVGYRTNLYFFSVNLSELTTLSTEFRSLYKLNKYVQKGIYYHNQKVVLKAGKER